MSELDGFRLPDADPGAAARAAARFAAAATPDVAYATVDSPVGPLLAAVTERGLVRIAYPDVDGGPDPVLEELSRRVSPRMLEAPARLDAVRRELDEYFDGGRTDFDVPLDWTLVTDFTRRILTACAKVPFGRTSTYGEMATAAGNPRASRAAGRALNVNPIPIVVPCHRIVGKSGALVGYAGGLERKIALLQLEGLAL